MKFVSEPLFVDVMAAIYISDFVTKSLCIFPSLLCTLHV